MANKFVKKSFHEPLSTSTQCHVQKWNDQQNLLGRTFVNFVKQWYKVNETKEHDLLDEIAKSKGLDLRHCNPTNVKKLVINGVIGASDGIPISVFKKLNPLYNFQSELNNQNKDFFHLADGVVAKDIPAYKAIF